MANRVYKEVNFNLFRSAADAMYNVLIVDEEEHLLWALEQNLFPERDDIEVITATTGEAGLEALQNEDIDLLVSDIKMPGQIDGFQLILRAKEVAPDARVIIMTAFGTNRIQNFADRIGITHYIEKPFNTSELRDAILEVLDEKEGFQGVLSDLELTDIIQMLCLAKRTALLHLKHKDHRGKIVFDRGDVVHAEFDEQTGEEAVFSMLALRQGDIFMQSDFQSDERTVDMGWQDLLFEGIKLADEKRHAAATEEGGEEEEEGDDDGPNTDVGMGVTEKVDEMLRAHTDAATNEEAGADSEPDPGAAGLAEMSQPFFSDAELAEIEQASEAVMEDASIAESAEAYKEERPSEKTDDRNDRSPEVEPGEVARPTVLAEEADSETITAEQEEFSLPFRESMDVKENTGAMWPSRAETKRGFRTIPPTEESVEIDLSLIEEGGFEGLLEEFAMECPGIRLTGIIAPDDGLALNFVELRNEGGYDPEAIAAFFSDVAGCATRTVQALHPDDELRELQIALEDEYILVRGLVGAPYLHIAVVEKDTSLGVALVLMRRFQKKIRTALEA